MKEQSVSNNYILYLDTSEPEAQISLYLGNELVLEFFWAGHRELSKTLSKKYEEILKKAKIKKADLAGICVFSGPGSFTGLRIGISFANGLAYGLNIPIYETTKKNTLNLKSKKKLVIPRYGSPAKITKPKKKIAN